MDIYVFSDAPVVAAYLSNASAIMGTGNYAVMLRTAMLAGVLITFLSVAIRGRDPGDAIKYGFGAILIYLIAILPRTNVTIESLKNGSLVSVSNVPMAIAAPASFISTMGLNLTNLFEVGFATPSGSALTGGDAVNPSNDPFLHARTVAAASRMFSEASNMTAIGSLDAPIIVSGVTFPFRVLEEIPQYINECVRSFAGKMDMTRQQFFAAPYSTAFLVPSGFAATARGAGVTCPAYHALIMDRLPGGSVIGAATWRAAFDADMRNWMNCTYTNCTGSFFDNLDLTASGGISPAEFVSMLMWRNGYDHGAIEAAFRSGNAAQAVALQQALDQRSAQWEGGSDIFLNSLGIMTGFVEGFSYSMVPIMGLVFAGGIAGLSMGVKYLWMLVWIQLWMPLLVMINYMIYIIGAHNNAAGLTYAASLSNLEQYEGFIMNLIDTGNYAITMVTGLATIIVYGASSIVSNQLAQNMQGQDFYNEKIVAQSQVSMDARYRQSSEGVFEPGVGYRSPTMNKFQNFDLTNTTGNAHLVDSSLSAVNQAALSAFASSSSGARASSNSGVRADASVSGGDDWAVSSGETVRGSATVRAQETANAAQTQTTQDSTVETTSASGGASAGGKLGGTGVSGGLNASANHQEASVQQDSAGTQVQAGDSAEVTRTAGVDTREGRFGRNQNTSSNFAGSENQQFAGNEKGNRISADRTRADGYRESSSANASRTASRTIDAATVAMRAGEIGAPALNDLMEAVSIRGLTNEMNRYYSDVKPQLDYMFGHGPNAEASKRAFAALATLFNKGGAALTGEDAYAAQMLGDTITDRIMGWDGAGDFYRRQSPFENQWNAVINPDYNEVSRRVAASAGGNPNAYGAAHARLAGEAAMASFDPRRIDDNITADALFMGDTQLGGVRGDMADVHRDNASVLPDPNRMMSIADIATRAAQGRDDGFSGLVMGLFGRAATSVTEAGQAIGAYMGLTETDPYTRYRQQLTEFMNEGLNSGGERAAAEFATSQLLMAWAVSTNNEAAYEFARDRLADTIENNPTLANDPAAQAIMRNIMDAKGYDQETMTDAIRTIGSTLEGKSDYQRATLRTDAAEEQASANRSADTIRQTSFADWRASEGVGEVRPTPGAGAVEEIPGWNIAP